MKRIAIQYCLPFFKILAYAQVKVKDPFEMKIEAASEDTVNITIKGQISQWAEYASANKIESKIKDLVDAGVTNARIYLNTRGGDTIEAVEIVNELRKLPGKIVAIGGAVVASAGSYIACKCDEFHVQANTQFMYHRPRLYAGGTLDEIKSTLKLLENTEKDYLSAYAKKTGKKEEDIEAAWSKGDQWLMGDEIVKAKFADKLINKEVEVTAHDVTVLEACAAPVIPKATASKESQQQHSNKNLSEMERNKIIAALGLSADATDAQIEAAISDNKAKAEKADSLENAQKENQVKALVQDALKDKKITADQANHYESLAKADFDSCKAILDGMKPLVKPETTPSASANGEDRSKWTYADYQAKAPEAFVELLKENPEKANALADAHYGN